MALDAWKQSDFLYRNYVLNGLADSLFNAFYVKKSTKKLWGALDKKYKAKDTGVKKFVVGQFLDFKMLRIEEDNRRKWGNTSTVKANVIEHSQSSGVKNKPPTSKSLKLGARGSVSKRSVYKPQEPTFRFNRKCFNCGSDGHRAVDCRKYSPQNKSRAHMVKMEDLLQDVDDMHLLAFVLGVNMVGSNSKELWVDSRATRHICADKKMFITFELASNDEKLFMENAATSTVEGKDKVVLKMTSGKELTLNDVLYVPDIRKNLISGLLLSKHCFRMVFESDKVVLTKSGVYVGNGYLSGCMFKLNVSSAYRFLVHKSDILDIYKNTITESRNAFFFEDVFPCRTRGDDQSSEKELEGDQDEEVDEPRRSKRARTAKSFG
ncbi:uncharacterized protein LOC114318075 [Camellia sinensis]|uniref:uncharacterized protein LOC114318075 n=1 Tax=Camellia sinensis TaxID=4442 RepID=UPI00103578AE|nr:uncharacterized protein LOC114318075 [Camellia sinensis]